MIEVRFTLPDLETFDRFYDFVSSSDFMRYVSISGESLKFFHNVIGKIF